MKCFRHLGIVDIPDIPCGEQREDGVLCLLCLCQVTELESDSEDMKCLEFLCETRLQLEL